MNERLIDVAASLRTTRLARNVVAYVIAGAFVFSQVPSAHAQGQPPSGKGAGATAAAAPSKAELASAKKHYGEGEKKYLAGDYAGALADFEAANDIKSTAQAERYIGLTQDKLGHLPAAVEWYDKFLAHVPEKLAAQGDEIRKRDVEIKAMPGKVHVESTPPGASLAIDDKPLAAVTPTDVELPPGSHTLKFTEPGRLPAQKQIDVAFASPQTVKADLEPEPPPPPPPPPPEPVAAAPPPPAPPPPQARSLVPAFVTGGLAVVAAGVGTVFGVMALSDKSNFDKSPTTSTADNGDTHALISDMSFGVALTFGVTSAVLFLTKDEPPAVAQAASRTTAKADTPKKRAITVEPAPVIGPHVGGAGVLLRF